jgi:hypothetical protein
MEEAWLSVGERRQRMSIFSSAALAIAMIAAFLLVLGGIRLVRDPQARSRGWLMIAAALVLVMNVTIWTI